MNVSVDYLVVEKPHIFPSKVKDQISPDCLHSLPFYPSLISSKSLLTWFHSVIFLSPLYLTASVPFYRDPGFVFTLKRGGARWDFKLILKKHGIV